MKHGVRIWPGSSLDRIEHLRLDAALPRQNQRRQRRRARADLRARDGLSCAEARGERGAGAYLTHEEQGNVLCLDPLQDRLLRDRLHMSRGSRESSGRRSPRPSARSQEWR